MHGRLLFRAAFDILKDATLAEDVVQQAFLKAWERRTDIAHPEFLKQWLIRAVVNGGLEMLRRRKTEKRLLKLGTIARDPSGIPTAETAELRELLLNAVADLPELSRAIVALRVLEGMSGNKVKDLLGCSAAEVSRHLHRGLEQLRRAMSASVTGARNA